MMSRTPPHAVTDAMFAEHQDGTVRLLFLEGGSDTFHAMFPVESFGLLVHDISQIGQFLGRERMLCLHPARTFMRISDASGLELYLDTLPA